MNINESLVKEIGSILKLEFTDAQMDTLVTEINQSISMFEELAQLDTEGVEGTFYGTVEGRARFRNDEAIRNKEEIAALLENAPATMDNLIQVPAILEDGEGGA